MTPTTNNLPPLTGRMIRRCMLCKDDYGRVPCIPAMDGKETHGLCATCFTSAMADVPPAPQREGAR